MRLDIDAVATVPRMVQLDIAAATWTAPAAPPAALAALRGRRWIWIPELLVHIGERTAPAEGYGIALSEWWAFLRYLGAVAADVPGLAISPGWDSLDSHQKTILSDDWGVGFASMVATHGLRAVLICDTSFLLARLGPSVIRPKVVCKKNGAFKSPDFIAFDGQKFHIVEAKGTQSTERDRVGQLETAQEQKTNIEFVQPGSVGQTLAVASLIPKRGDGMVDVRVEDPPTMLDLPDSFLTRAWFGRGALASAFRCAGLGLLADYLADPRFDNWQIWADAVRWTRRAAKLQGVDLVGTSQVFSVLDREGKHRRVSAQIGVAPSVLESLERGGDINKAVDVWLESATYGEPKPGMGLSNVKPQQGFPLGTIAVAPNGLSLAFVEQ